MAPTIRLATILVAVAAICCCEVFGTRTTAFIFLNVLVLFLEDPRSLLTSKKWTEEDSALDVFRAMERHAQDLLRMLEDARTSNEILTQQLTTLKSHIKQNLVEKSAIPPIINCVRLGVNSPHGAVASISLSTLANLFRRLGLQDRTLLTQTNPLTFPLLLDQLSTRRDRHRALVDACLTELWRYIPQDVESFIQNSALVNDDSRTRQSSMQWLAQMNNENGFRMKRFVPNLITSLEDTDTAVTETAKDTVIELFQNAPERAKVDLRSKLQRQNIQMSIANDILSRIDQAPRPPLAYKVSQGESIVPPPPASAKLEQSGTSATRKAQSQVTESKTVSEKPSNSLKSRKVNVPLINSEPLSENPHNPSTSIEAKGPAIPPSKSSAKEAPSVLTQPQDDVVEPLDVRSAKELEEMFRAMHVHFEGRESESNWSHRERDVKTLRRLTAGNAPKKFLVAYQTEIKNIFDGILKAINSLRTTVASSGCTLIRDIARYTNMKFEPVIEVLLQNLIKLSGNTKKLNAHNGTSTLEMLLAHIPYSTRIMHHLWGALQEKNAQLRTFATNWLRVVILAHANHKSQMDHGSDGDLIEKCLRKGLTDSIAGVRQGMRQSFWAYEKALPTKAESLYSTLDASTIKALENDPANPNRPRKAEAPTAPKFERAKTAPSASSKIREQIQQQRKKAAAAAAAAAAAGIENHSEVLLPTAQIEAIGGQSSVLNPHSGNETQDTNKLGLASKRPVRPGRPKHAATAGVISLEKLDAPVPAEAEPPTEFLRAEALPPADALMTDELKPAESAVTAELSLAVYNAIAENVPTAPEHINTENKVVIQSRRPSNTSQASLSSTISEKSNGSTRIPTPIVRSRANSGASQSSVASLASANLPQQAETIGGQGHSRTDSALSRSSSTSAGSGKNRGDSKIPFLPGTVLNLTPKNEGAKMKKLSPKASNSSLRQTGPKKTSSPPKTPEPTPHPKGPKTMNVGGHYLTVEANLHKNFVEHGLQKLRTASADIAVFRKLQNLIKDEDEIWEIPQLLHNLLMALLHDFERPAAGQIVSGKSHDLKAQCYVTIRHIFQYRIGTVRSAHLHTALCAMVATRKLLPERSHIIPGLQETSRLLMKKGNTEECLTALCTQLDKEHPSEGRTSIWFGLAAIEYLLSKSMAKHELDDKIVRRVSTVVIPYLDIDDTLLRQAAINCCLTLKTEVGSDERFWKLIEAAKGDHRSLIEYYANRLERPRMPNTMTQLRPDRPFVDTYRSRRRPFGGIASGSSSGEEA
ncbi:MAG: suppressor of tub2 mutation [Sclerophora amabilis]|nr:MAG: suppressor of tub2 mutation [Sclerophora amabilis]